MHHAQFTQLIMIIQLYYVYIYRAFVSKTRAALLYRMLYYDYMKYELTSCSFNNSVTYLYINC